MGKLPAFVVTLLLIVSLTVCAATPVVAETAFEVEDFEDFQDWDANTILNDSDQADLIQLVVFAFTIGIIMTILGFAMGMMYFKRR